MARGSRPARELASEPKLAYDLEMTIIRVMVRVDRFQVIYAPQVKDHLKAIDRHDHSLIRRNIEERLQFEPMIRTRNRKPLQHVMLDAEWEIRFGPGNCFRVFYEVDERRRSVSILAIGVKERSRLRVGGIEVTQ